MAALKTKKTELSVQSFIKKIPEDWKRRDALVILDVMERATKCRQLHVRCTCI